MADTKRFDPDDILSLQREQRAAREARWTAESNRSLKRSEAWTMERASYEDELNAFVDRNVGRAR